MAQKSNIRGVIAEALDTYGAKGALAEEIYSLIYDDLYGDNETSKRKSLSNGLFRSCEADLVVKHENRYYLAELAPKALQPIPIQAYEPAPNHSGLAGMLTRRADKIRLPDFQKTRNPVSLVLYASPLTIEDVVAFELVFGTNRMRYPHDRWQVCVGDEKPLWSDTQESMRVTGLSFIHSDGAVDDLFFPKGITVTIARRN